MVPFVFELGKAYARFWFDAKNPRPQRMITDSLERAAMKVDQVAIQGEMRRIGDEELDGGRDIGTEFVSGMGWR